LDSQAEVHAGMAESRLKFTMCLREAVRELVNETKAAGKFERRDDCDAGATLITELNPKMMLKDV
jgi:hypothetical protein